MEWRISHQSAVDFLGREFKKTRLDTWVRGLVAKWMKGDTAALEINNGVFVEKIAQFFAEHGGDERLPPLRFLHLWLRKFDLLAGCPKAKLIGNGSRWFLA